MTKESTMNLVSPQDLLERALSSPKGIRVWFKSEAEAISMRNRMSTVKTRERKKSTKLYEMSSQLYNRCPYDDLAIVLKAGELSRGEEVSRLLNIPPEERITGVWMYILPQGTSDQAFIVEEL